MMLLIPTPFDFIAFKYAPQSLVVPLGSMAIVYTLLFSPCVTKEKVTVYDYLAVLIIIAGCVTTTLTGSKESPELSIDDLRKLWLSPTYLIAQGTIIIFALGCYSLTKITDSSSKIVRKLQPICYAFISASFGSLQNIVLKMVTKLTSNSSSWSDYPLYLSIIAVLVLATRQLGWLNKGLAVFDGVVFLPVYNTTLILLSTLVGSVFYQEYKTQSNRDLGLFALGCFIAVSGILIIAIKAKHSDFSAEAAVFPNSIYLSGKDSNNTLNVLSPRTVDKEKVGSPVALNGLDTSAVTVHGVKMKSPMRKRNISTSEVI